MVSIVKQFKIYTTIAMIRCNKKIIILCIVFLFSLISMAFFAVALFLENRTARVGQEFYAGLGVEYKPRITGYAPINRQSRPAAIDFGTEEASPFPIDFDTEEASPFPIDFDTEEASSFPIDFDTEEACPFPIDFDTEEANCFFIDFEAKREVFPDIVAWIQSENTVINYPVVQGSDNAFYIYHLPDKSPHRMGSVFLDYRNSPNFTDQTFVFYGHDMPSEDMFGSLRHYADQTFFEGHDSMFIFTPEQNFKMVIFAGYIIDSATEVPPMWFCGSEGFDRFIADIKSRSLFSSDVEVSYGEQLAFLATCVAADSSNDRLIIAGKMEEI